MILHTLFDKLGVGDHHNIKRWLDAHLLRECKYVIKDGVIYIGENTNLIDNNMLIFILPEEEVPDYIKIDECRREDGSPRVFVGELYTDAEWASICNDVHTIAKFWNDTPVISKGCMKHYAVHFTHCRPYYIERMFV